MRATDMQDAMHLDEGQIATLRDEGPTDPWTFSHAKECHVCAAELADARMRAATVEEALMTLDAPVDVAAAKAAVRRRLDRERSRPQQQSRQIPFGRAAAILLVTAGAAAALPWSPLSRWLSPTAPSPATAPTSLPTSPAQAPRPADLETTVSMNVVDRIDVIVSGASSGAALDVVWRDGAEALVAAPRGSSFSLATSRVEVGATDGAVRVEIPRAAAATVVVNGRTYLRRSTEGLSLVEPATEVSDERVRFLVRAP